MSRLWERSGMAGVLAVLVIALTLATLSERPVEGAAGGESLARSIRSGGSRVLVAGGSGGADREFVEALERTLLEQGHTVTAVAHDPAAARSGLDPVPEIIATTPAAARWSVFDPVRDRLRTAEPRRYSVFLSRANLLNVLNQISVIAILAVGMTLVILIRGIDLSVGSLIALSAVVTAALIERLFGGTSAGPAGMAAAAAGGILICAAAGLTSGVLSAACGIPSFISTLAMMLIASGAAFLLSRGESIYQLPESFVWLGRGADLGLPNAVVLTVVLYALAYVLLAHTVLGRHIRAIGNNPQAARFSGIPLRTVRITVHGICGALAGVGGVVMASQLRSGAPTYGVMYELYAIAAVVVGGTSLIGGRGGVVGTLVGALIIAVIQNGMNLIGVESYTQKIVLGIVILAAVLVDRLSRRGSQAQSIDD